MRLSCGIVPGPNAPDIAALGEAAATARSTSFALPSAMRAIGSSVAG